MKCGGIAQLGSSALFLRKKALAASPLAHSGEVVPTAMSALLQYFRGFTPFFPKK